MTTEPQATEYADGLRALAAMLDADPGLGDMLGYALRSMAKPNLTYDQLDVLAQAATSAGATVEDRTDSTWRYVYVTFGAVTLYGYGPVQRDPEACPRCGSLDPNCGSSEVPA